MKFISLTQGTLSDPVEGQGNPGIQFTQSQAYQATEDRIRKWFERAWNEGDETAIRELMSTEAEVLGLGTSVMNPAGFMEIQRTFHQTFDQILVDLVDLVCGEDSAAGHARFSAFHRASEREVDVFFSFAGRFEDGKLVWLRHVFDFTALLSQLGTLDPRAVGLVFKF